MAVAWQESLLWFWANTDAGGSDESAQIFVHSQSQPISVDHSCVQGLTGSLGGTGNIGADPQFVDPDGPDDDPGTLPDNDYRVLAGSPCIDAGDNNPVPADEFDLDEDGDTEEPLPFDLDGNPRFVDDPDTLDTGNGEPPIVDMGAYELQLGDDDDDDSGSDSSSDDSSSSDSSSGGSSDDSDDESDD